MMKAPKDRLEDQADAPVEDTSDSIELNEYKDSFVFTTREILDRVEFIAEMLMSDVYLTTFQKGKFLDVLHAVIRDGWYMITELEDYTRANLGTIEFVRVKTGLQTFHDGMLTEVKFIDKDKVDQDWR